MTVGLFAFLFVLEKLENSVTANQPIKILQKENKATSARSATFLAHDWLQHSIYVIILECPNMAPLGPEGLKRILVTQRGN